MKELIKNINGNRLHISALDFQGDNKKFYITYHLNSFDEFDLTFNKNWIENIGIDSALEKIEYILLDPRKAIVNRWRKLRRIYIKLDFYRKKQLEKEKQLLMEKRMEKFNKIENPELTLVMMFRSLNEFGKERAIDYIEDLTEMNRYKLEV